MQYCVFGTILCPHSVLQISYHTDKQKRDLRDSGSLVGDPTIFNISYEGDS